MARLSLSSAAIALMLSASAAQAQAVTHHKKSAKPAAEEKVSEPPDPVAMQKWFSGAVGDILTDTSRTLDDMGKTTR